jgi:Ca2+-binding EF-hand superfamily protein
MAQYDLNSDGVFDLDEFRYGWNNEAHEMEFDEPTEEKVITNFEFADANGDGLLDLEEGMILRPPVIGSHYVDGFMYFDANQDRMLDIDEFSAAYKALDEYVEDGLIATAFKLGDLNDDGNLTWDEFYRLSLIKDG